MSGRSSSSSGSESGEEGPRPEKKSTEVSKDQPRSPSRDQEDNEPNDDIEIHAPRDDLARYDHYVLARNAVFFSIFRFTPKQEK